MEAEVRADKDKTHEPLLGIVIFIGGLLNLKMILESIIHRCTLKGFKDECKSSLECLWKLLSTVGEGLDTEADRESRAVSNTYVKHTQTTQQQQQAKRNGGLEYQSTQAAV